ncbi:esterase/lipase superfamily enzyme [Friedmanniella endophytica]|uniref:Esterase/lipase superfamily enzyme n=1 Tax=Microlunatus kandeliicorticis TaxID=1759536 RepID=A0A7W3IUW7_9ACTN|nr:alpha/beta hydrolase-fold protein [Microlunatus kandeliicorticis]MBA8795682.1 esterase/lipase superfamily enzyme [Microlunatus kandeliicorticis]
MNRHQVELPLHEHRPGHEGTRNLHVIRYGHWGRPVLVFPSEAGRAWDFENNGMIEAVRPLIEAGRVKLYCVDSLDAETWSDQWLPTEERARRHGVYTRWLIDQVVPFVHADSGGPPAPGSELITTGCSLGAYHAVQFTLQRADLAPLAIGLSGNYDPSTWRPWGETGEALYFANPTSYVPHLHGDHLEWLRQRVSILLVVGQGAWETHPTGALPSSVRFAEILRSKGIRSELDLWGYDVSHDWEWWARQLAHHLPRFC